MLTHPTPAERGQFGHAVELAERALGYATSTGDDAVIANLQSTLGYNLVAAGALERGLDFLQRALDEFRATGDREGQAMTLWALGHTNLTSGSQAEGRRLLRESLEIARDLRFAQPVPGILLWAANVLSRAGSVHDAVLLVGAAEKIVAGQEQHSTK